MKMKSLAISTMIIFLALVALGQTKKAPPQPPRESILERPVLGDNSEYYEATDAFYASLGRARVPGGMIRIVKCGEDAPKQIWRPAGSPLHQVLDGIVAADSRYKWEVQDGAVNLLPVAGEPALLNVQIDKFHVKKMTWAWDALSELVRLPEIEKARKELGLKPGIAFVLSSNPPWAKEFSVRLKGVTLRQALNAIATAQGSATWDYIEVHCGDRHEVVIRF